MNIGYVFVKRPVVRVECRPTRHQLPGESQRRAWALYDPKLRLGSEVTQYQFRAVCTHCDWEITSYLQDCRDNARWHREAHRRGFIPGEQDLWGNLVGEVA